MYESFEDRRNVYIVMELCEGGELFDYIIDKGIFDEQDALRIFTQIMQAINYCHTQLNICHRDLKPENFLFLTKDRDKSPIKVIDFGLSRVFGEDVLDINTKIEEQSGKAIRKGRKRRTKRGERGGYNMQTRAGTVQFFYFD